MNIIELMQSIVMSFPKLNDFLHIDYTTSDTDSYGLSPTGDTLIKSDVLGNQERQHTFILYAVYQSVNDYDRLANSGLINELQLWLEKQAKGQTLTVTVGNNELAGTLTKITCSNGMLYDIPDSNLIGNVMYQLQITADYKIESEEF
jgi:hypothetical protein